MSKRIRAFIWWQLIYLADRICPEQAFRRTGVTFYFVEGKGVVTEFATGRGCPLWHQGKADYEKAHQVQLSPPATPPTTESGNNDPRP